MLAGGDRQYGRLSDDMLLLGAQTWCSTPITVNNEKSPAMVAGEGEGVVPKLKPPAGAGGGTDVVAAGAAVLLSPPKLNKFDAAAGCFALVDAEESKVGAGAALFLLPELCSLRGSNAEAGAGVSATAWAGALAGAGAPAPKLNPAVAGAGVLATAGTGALAGAGAPAPKLNAVVAGVGALVGAGAGAPAPKLNAVDVAAGVGALVVAGAGAPAPKLNAVDVAAGAGVDPKLTTPPFPSVFAAVGALAVVVEPKLNVAGAGAKKMNMAK